MKKYRDPNKLSEKQDWLGVVYFLDGNAWMWIDGDSVVIGTEATVRAAIKKYDVDPNEPSLVKNAIIKWRQDNPQNSLNSSPEPKIKAFGHEDSKSYGGGEKQLILVL